MPYELAGDDVAAVLTFVAAEMEPVLDPDIEEPDWEFSGTWRLEALLSRVGWPAFERMLVDLAAQDELRSRGSGHVVFVPRLPLPAGPVTSPASWRSRPDPVTVATIDRFLDHYESGRAGLRPRYAAQASGDVADA
ncbi:hypothetical protein D5S19_01120 [Amycolatopsis panacis]|uniref:Uncharacterized protein n=2 Tax=Amycolatopsis panacis TaxID=2340917 RepID=A0A419IBV5_9PSEU|nr:hypothetical protein D5S19_01120 [Amycolatopsis panacis]